MNGTIAHGKWQQLMGALSAQWGTLTGDRLRVISGRHQQLAGRLLSAYGEARRELGAQMDGVQRRAFVLRAKAQR